VFQGVQAGCGEECEHRKHEVARLRHELQSLLQLFQEQRSELASRQQEVRTCCMLILKRTNRLFQEALLGLLFFPTDAASALDNLSGTVYTATHHSVSGQLPVLVTRLIVSTFWQSACGVVGGIEVSACSACYHR